MHEIQLAPMNLQRKYYFTFFLIDLISAQRHQFVIAISVDIRVVDNKSFTIQLMKKKQIFFKLELN